MAVAHTRHAAAGAITLTPPPRFVAIAIDNILVVLAIFVPESVGARHLVHIPDAGKAVFKTFINTLTCKL
jgi:hypothetical protein